MQYGLLLAGLWTTRSFTRVTPPVNVLIVDDERAVADALAAALTTDGFRTTVIDDGYSVLGVPPAVTPDVVILDIEMASCDGFGD